jgi:hypothetical protein
MVYLGYLLNMVDLSMAMLVITRWYVLFFMGKNHSLTILSATCFAPLRAVELLGLRLAGSLPMGQMGFAQSKNEGSNSKTMGKSMQLSRENDG